MLVATVVRRGHHKLYAGGRCLNHVAVNTFGYFDKGWVVVSHDAFLMGHTSLEGASLGAYCLLAYLRPIKNQLLTTTFQSRDDPPIPRPKTSALFTWGSQGSKLSVPVSFGVAQPIRHRLGSRIRP